MVDNQLKSYSFLSQTRVRLLGPEGLVVGDSGDPREVRKQASITLGMEIGGLSQSFTREVDEGSRETRFSSELLIQGTTAAGDEEAVHVVENVVVTGNVPGEAKNILEGAENLAGGSTFAGQIGFGFVPEPPLGDHRSGQVLLHAVTGPFGRVLGSLELSEGPAIGRGIVNTVTWVWAVSGGIAVLVAVSVGWYISRRLTSPLLNLTRVATSMAGGDLSTRAGVSRRDELGELATSFNEMASRVEDTVQTLRRFVADAAHQIHTPLTALGTDLELLAREGDDTDPQALVERARTEVKRLAALSDGLLDLSRIQTASADPEHTSISLGELVQEASEIYASQAEQAGVSFSLDLPEESVIMRGAESRLRQALGNLLDNAIKFTPEGGQVSVSLWKEGEWASLGVYDTGIGIPEADLPNLFERFHRGRNAAAYAGNGLGLAIVKAIVEGHDGQVWADSTPHGARFYVRVPLKPPP